MSSINVPTSGQVQSATPRAARIYFGANGTDVVDVGLSLDWILTVLQEYVTSHGEDVAVWMREEGDTPRLVAMVHPAPHRPAVIKMI